MDTDSQPKKRRSKPTDGLEAQTILKITANQWWPFDRAPSDLLEKLHRQLQKAQTTAAPEALL